MLGLPAEPQEDLGELLSEVRAEIEARQRKEKVGSEKKTL